MKRTQRFIRISRAVFSMANLSKATLIGANFSGTMFFGAHLTEASFSLAKFMDDAELRDKLGKIDLRKTHLKGATIDKPSLDEVSVTKEQIETLIVISS